MCIFNGCQVSCGHCWWARIKYESLYTEQLELRLFLMYSNCDAIFFVICMLTSWFVQCLSRVASPAFPTMQNIYYQQGTTLATTLGALLHLCSSNLHWLHTPTLLWWILMRWDHCCLLTQHRWVAQAEVDFKRYHWNGWHNLWACTLTTLEFGFEYLEQSSAIQVMHWTEVLTGKLSNDTKLVGSYISCEGYPRNGVPDEEWRLNPYVLPHTWATDQASKTRESGLLASDARHSTRPDCIPLNGLGNVFFFILSCISRSRFTFCIECFCKNL